jgi:hypothetical protein
MQPGATATEIPQARRPEKEKMDRSQAAPAASPRKEMRQGLVSVIYVMGSGRSGSTLFDIVLGNHPRIESMGELTNLVRDCWVRGVYCACGARGCDCDFWNEVRRRWIERMGSDDIHAYAELKHNVERRSNVLRLGSRRSPSEALRRYGEQTRALFEAISEVGGRPIVVDSSKIPARAMALSMTPGIDLRIIHLVRDGRGVAYSRRKAFRQDMSAGLPAEIRPTPLWRSSMYWTRENLQSEWAMRRLDPSRTARVRYEDFIEDPSTVLANVGRTVDVDLDGVAAALLAGMPMTARHTISGNRVRMAGAIRLKPDTEWKERLRPVTRRAMYMLTVPLMRRYGYRM